MQRRKKQELQDEMEPDWAFALLRQLAIADVFGVTLAVIAHIAHRYGLIAAELEPIVGWFKSGAIAGIVATLIATLLYLRIRNKRRH